MLNTITILAAMTATSGCFGHAKSCGGGRLPLVRHRAATCSAPVMSSCGSAPMMNSCGSAPSYAMQAPMGTAPMASSQAMSTPQAMSKSLPMSPPVYPSSSTVPPAPSVPPAPTPAAPPAPPVPSAE